MLITDIYNPHYDQDMSSLKIVENSSYLRECRVEALKPFILNAIIMRGHVIINVPK